MRTITKYILIFWIPLISGKAIILDGNLDEPEWESAFVIDEYYEVVPFTLNPAKVKTTAKIFSNEEGIYVGFINYQKNSSMISNKSLRDEWNANAEQNGVGIDFDSDCVKAYMFIVTLANIQRDGIRPLGGFPEFDWDGDWEAQTKKHDGFWVSEFLIPWNVVLMKPETNNKRKINVTTYRYLAKEKLWLNDTKTSGFRTNFLSNLRTIEVNNFAKRKINFFPFI